LAGIGWHRSTHIFRSQLKRSKDVVGITVEGVVTEFHPAARIKGYESFTVSGESSSYCKSCTRQGFTMLRLESSPIANGMEVQILYIDDHILKLGIRRRYFARLRLGKYVHPLS
jgi:hypothetical protein